MVCKELSSGTVGWIFARGTVSLGSFVVPIRKVFISPPFFRKGGVVVSVRVVVTTFTFTFTFQ